MKLIEMSLQYPSNHLQKTFVTFPSIQIFYLAVLNPIQDGGAKKVPPTSFPPATSTNVGTSSPIFLTFTFTTFATLVSNCKFILSVSPKLLNLNQDYPSKRAFFLVKSL